ncbi:DUF308 domain-containing protein [Bradyrhizobium sp.]|jgi:hypothetical protein|uniref:DUF308 domain-containing protein n=1 Tax=Bradyrhizobium sp. TaxID=376 RepID=UPI002DF88F1E|nr:DUF308 domain-containing protein [Bradyrhizobium sp.]
MMMLMIAGIAVLAAGLLAIVFGIPVKEFSFGNTLILAGAIAACAGAILLGLSVVVREIRNIARRLGSADLATSRVSSDQQASAAGSGDRPPDNGVLPGRDQPAPEDLDAAKPAPSPSAGSAPWRDEAAARDRARSRGDVTAEPAPSEAAAATKARRNLLFSSSSRRERERAARTTDPAAADSGPAPPVTPPDPKDAAPASFEDAWPQSDRARPDALRRTRTPSTFAEPNAATPAPERPAPTASSEESAPVTVLKSGVVDGMAYSLYSDGSIEAQMPEGMMRFASIDELRSHLDQRP